MVSNNSIVLTNATPADTELNVADIGSAGNGRADFAAGSSGLTYSFGSLASATDHIGFSNNNGADAAVTNICFCLQGTMAASAAVTLRLRYRIK
jgi:hypothetical protein